MGLPQVPALRSQGKPVNPKILELQEQECKPSKIKAKIHPLSDKGPSSENHRGLLKVALEHRAV